MAETSKNYNEKYPFLKSLDEDSALCVICPANTKYEDLKDLFSIYGTVSIPKPKDPFLFIVYFFTDFVAASKAKKDLQYLPINKGYLVITKKSEQNYIEKSARLYITTADNFDPNKLHRHFEDDKFKVSHVKKTNSGFFIQYYTQEDCDEAYKRLRKKEFEGYTLRIEKAKEKQTTKDFDAVIHKDKAKTNPGLVLSEQIITPDEILQYEDAPKKVKSAYDTNEIVNERNENIVSKKEISIPKEPSNILLAASNEKRFEEKKEANLVEENKKDKIIAKLEKNLNMVIQSDEICKILIQRMKRLDRDQLEDYLIADGDEWIIDFFKTITEI